MGDYGSCYSDVGLNVANGRVDIASDRGQGRDVTREAMLDRFLAQPIT